MLYQKTFMKFNFSFKSKISVMNLEISNIYFMMVVMNIPHIAFYNHVLLVHSFYIADINVLADMALQMFCIE